MDAKWASVISGLQHSRRKTLWHAKYETPLLPLLRYATYYISVTQIIEAASKTTAVRWHYSQAVQLGPQT